MTGQEAHSYAEFLRGQAQRCRRLAELKGTDPQIAMSLRTMALDYERQANMNLTTAACLPAREPAADPAQFVATSDRPSI